MSELRGSFERVQYVVIGALFNAATLATIHNDSVGPKHIRRSSRPGCRLRLAIRHERL